MNVTELAANYRRLLLWFGVQMLFDIAAVVKPHAVDLFGLVTVAAIMIYTYRIAEALGSTKPALWSLAMLLPIVNLVALFSLSADASKVCRANGIEVGLLGPRIET